MSIQVTHHEVGGVQVLTIGSEAISIDEDNLEEISQQLLDFAVSIPPQIVVDMQHIEFYGSSFIETLFRMWNRVKSSENGRFGLAGLQPYCREILTITNLDSVWSVFEDVDTAVAEFSSK
jgi:anti-sigma B factor antagonist